MADFGLTDAGLQIPRAADLLESIRDAYREETGLTDIDFANDALLGVFAGIVSERLESVAGLAAAIYDAFDPNNAGGVQLSNIAALTGALRKGGTASRVPLTLAGTPGLPVPSGIRVEGGGPDDNAQWITIEDATLDGSGVATGVTAELFDAVGAVDADPGAVDSIVTPFDGLATVTNPDRPTLGTERESDRALRARRLRSPSAAGGRSVSAIIARLLAVDGVSDVLFADNPDNTTQVVASVSLPPHSYALYILPNPLNATVQALVLDVLEDNLQIGLRNGITPDFSRVVSDSLTGASQTVGATYGELIAVSGTGTVTLAAGTSLSGVQGEMDTRVSTFIADLGLGEALSELDLCTIAAGIEGVVNAAFVLTGAVNGVFTPQANEKINAVTLPLSEA